MKKMLSFLLATILCATLAACGTSSTKKVDIKTIDDQEGLVRASIVIPVEPERMKSAQKAKELVFYPTYNEVLLAIKSGKADFSVIPEIVAKYFVAQDDAFTYNIMETPRGNTFEDFVMLLRDNDVDLLSDVNDAIGQLRDDGTLDELFTTYIENFAIAPQEPELEAYETNGKLTVGISGEQPPLDYVTAQGKPAGFNVVLMNKIGKILGKEVEFVVLSNDAKTQALLSERIDIFFWAINYGVYSNEPLSDGIAYSDMYATSPRAAIFLK